MATSWLPGNSVAENVIAVSAAVTALGVLWRQAIRPIVHNINRAISAIDRVEEQFANNGGSTLRDAVDRIDNRTDRFDRRLDVIENRVAVIEAAHRDKENP